MDTVEDHPHSFPLSEWPFQEATNTATFTTTHVIREGHPILSVYHDHDGDWQFLCGAPTDVADAMLVCLGCTFERDRSIGELADLPIGWQAWRESADAPWQRASYEANGLNVQFYFT